VQTGLEFLHGGGGEENVNEAGAHGIVEGEGGDVVADLLGAGGVNVEQGALVFAEGLADGLLQCAVEVAVHLGVFEEAVFGDEPLERLGGQEVVVLAVHLVAARLARGAGDGVAHFGIALQQHIAERCLARPRRCRNHNEKRSHTSLAFFWLRE